VRPDKGVRELFDAALMLMRDFDDVDFHLAGEYAWRNPFADRLIEDVKARGLEGRIRFVGEIKDVDGLLRQCDLHVCPSISVNESFPNVVLEAKAQSLPSVVFPTAGLPEAVTHLVDGYICPERSASALYEGIKYFIVNPAALREMGEAARRSLARFSEERAADHWSKVFGIQPLDARSGRAASGGRSSVLSQS
jgi:glycosyltransferase involved in cell wall biosynthesis